MRDRIVREAGIAVPISSAGTTVVKLGSPVVAMSVVTFLARTETPQWTSP
ncbi:hypothetical protein [Streptomyces luteolifulvus]|jgi:hypothetical protein|nr:hypothetical protein [Streptomyces luteolifulvus]